MSVYNLEVCPLCGHKQSVPRDGIYHIECEGEYCDNYVVYGVKRHWYYDAGDHLIGESRSAAQVIAMLHKWLLPLDGQSYIVALESGKITIERA